MSHDFILGGDGILIALVIAGSFTQLAAAWQFVLVAGHFLRNHYGGCAPVFPRTAILIPAWNEAAVIGASIDRLMALDYPRDRLRIGEITCHQYKPPAAAKQMCSIAWKLGWRSAASYIAGMCHSHMNPA